MHLFLLNSILANEHELRPGESQAREERTKRFEDWKVPPGQEPTAQTDVFQPMHGLKLVIKEDVLPQEQLPKFPAVERLAEKGVLAVDTWNSKREIVNFKATIEVPMLGSIIENSGDALDKSHMPLGWPLPIDGALRQFCSHKTATIQELDNCKSMT